MKLSMEILKEVIAYVGTVTSVSVMTRSGRE